MKNTLIPLLLVFALAASSSSQNTPRPLHEPFTPTRLDWLQMWGMSGLCDEDDPGFSLSVTSAQDGGKGETMLVRVTYYSADSRRRAEFHANLVRNGLLEYARRVWGWDWLKVQISIEEDLEDPPLAPRSR